MHKKIIILGSASNVGKSLITAGVGRILKKDGYSVAPFKPQNIALNSFVDNNGNEMGFAQYLQADMMGIAPQVYMQPILLKYIKGTIPQVIIEGKIADYNLLQSHDFIAKTILKNYKHIQNNFDVAIMEGSGSCAEINLLSKELANIGLAKLLKSHAVLVVDVEKGGVFAQIYGTIMLLPKADRKLIRGIIINKFHGDKTHLQSGLDILHKRLLFHNLDIPILGIIPYISLKLPEEDIMAMPNTYISKNNINIAVIKLPHIANFTDFKVFEYYPDVNLYYTTKPLELDYADGIIIAGSKEIIQDLHYLKENGFAERIQQANKIGITIFGICAGLQMLGKKLLQNGNSIRGLGLLDITTVFYNKKTTKQVTATMQNLNNELSCLNNMVISGYEIHQGESTSNEKCFLYSERPLGYYKNNLYTTYLHDIFNNSLFTAHFLNLVRKKKGLNEIKEYYSMNYNTLKTQEYDKWERHLRHHLDVERLINCYK